MGKALRDELANDPKGFGYDTMTDAEAADTIMAETIDIRVEIPVPNLSKYLTETGIWKKLQKAAGDVDADGNPTSLAYAAESLLAVSQAPPPSVDIDSAGLQNDLDTLEAADAGITSSERSGIEGLADRTINRARQRGLGSQREGDISRARS